MSTTLYVIEQARWAGGDVSGSLIAPDGQVIYGHMSSSSGWLIADLTKNFGRARELELKYPGGFDVKYIPVDGEVPEAIKSAWSD